MVTSPRHPEQFGATTLYKFRAYDTEEHREWVRQILVDHKVWFSRSSELDDKHDLKPILRFRRGKSDGETRTMLFEDAERVWARTIPPLTPNNLSRNRARIETAPLESLEREATERTHRRLEEYWIFSLAASRDWLRMWQNYADNSRGLCIHFHTDSRSPFRFAQKVVYQTERPVLLFPFSNTQHDEIGTKCTRTKALKWEIQDEYRYIRYPDTDFSSLSLGFDGQHAYFPPEALAGITVGPKMPEKDVASIVKMASSHVPVLQVSRPTEVVSGESA